jgi:hypothetical protein
LRITDHTSRPVMRRALILIVVAGLIWPAAAQAVDPPQTFVVPACSTARGPHLLSGWIPSNFNVAGTFDNCSRGGTFGAHAPGTSGDFAYWMFEVPADIRIAGLRVWRRGQFTSDGVYDLHAIWENDEGVGLEDQTDLPAGAAQFAEFTNLDATFLGMSIFCVAGGNCPAEPWNTVEFTRMEMVLRDAFVPRAEGELTGTAMQVGELSGDVSLRTGYSDRGGGLKQAALLVDGSEVKRVGIGCREPYDTTLPCPRSGSTEVVLDTRTVPDGNHKLQLALIDVAGNRGLTAPADVVVRNGPPVTAPWPGAVRPGKLTVARRSLRGRHNRMSRIAASLVDTAGVPIAGATVAVAMRTNVRGSSYAAATPVVTDARGNLTLKVPKGPSRVVRLTYGDSTATVSIKVKAPLRLKVSPKRTRNGGTVRLTGSVAGTNRSTRIELQAFSGGHWFPFKTVALRKGSFSGRYRFTRTFSAQRYRFRAVVHADRDFPYTAATSPVVAVRVRP